MLRSSPILRANPTKTPHDPGTALFGGWRIEHMEQARDEAGWRGGFEAEWPERPRPRVRRL